ncbi:MAG: hypothetical protein WC455_13740, partial [Dehalococcoidia bacterium]
MKYLDCGCALDDSGKRHWCPTCADGGPREPKKEEHAMTLREKVLANYIEMCPEAMALNPHADGAQILDGKWYVPRWGCDTLEHTLDALLSTADSEQRGLRYAFAALLRSHSWYTTREYERDTTYNNQSRGYQEEALAV